MYLNMPQATFQFSIEYRSIAACPADVAVLRYARGFQGIEKTIKDCLVSRGVSENDIAPGDGEHCLVDSRGGIEAQQALYVGTVPIGLNQYQTIREFTARSLAILARETPAIRHVAMTIHGVGRGLDETECALAQLRGILHAIKQGTFPQAIERITICEISEKRALRIQSRLAAYLSQAGFPAPQPNSEQWSVEIHHKIESPPASFQGLPAVSDDADQKPRAFVAMPFREELDDIFFYGIQHPIHQTGLLCERVDQTVYTGDVLVHIKTRIEQAKVVIAELTDASANVYLEVGYAWGRRIPTILLTQDSQALRFDIRNQRCLVYRRIKDLEEILLRELSELRKSGAL